MLIRLVFIVLSLSAPLIAAEARPNIVFLLADDLRFDALGCAGNKIIQTPQIDSLASRGVMFKNHFVTTSICCVSRASIFSGQYARRHGIIDFNQDFTPAALAQTYPSLLRAAGYRVGFIGKYGVGDKLPKEAFDYWQGFPGQGRYFSKGDPVHKTEKMGNQAIEFLKECDGTRPFCLSISFKAPHALDGAKREFPPDLRDEKLYEDATIPLLKTCDEKYFNALPEFVQTSEGRTRWKRRFATPEMAQATARDYYRLVSGIDREVGRILATLDELKLAANTIVIFTSDNGEFLGERGMADKWLMYEESLRVPLIVFDPRQPAARRAVKLDAMSLNIDLAPTILELCDVPVPATMQGRSLLPLLRGESPTPAWRTDFFYEHHTQPKILPPSEGIRSERYAYIRYTEPNPLVEELYDIQADPLEEHNLIAAPEHKAALDALRLRWEQLSKELK